MLKYFKGAKKMNYFDDERNLYWAKVNERGIIPTRESENAGYDLYACFQEDFILIPPHSTKLIPTGIAWACSENFYLQIEERSSTGSKGIKKSAGVIDSGYRGEIKVAITNSRENDIVISNLQEDEFLKKYPHLQNALFYPAQKGIAQGIVHRVEKMNEKEISFEELSRISSKRGDLGWGSSGK